MVCSPGATDLGEQQAPPDALAQVRPGNEEQDAEDREQRHDRHGVAPECRRHVDLQVAALEAPQLVLDALEAVHAVLRAVDKARRERAVEWVLPRLLAELARVFAQLLVLATERVEHALDAHRQRAVGAEVAREPAWRCRVPLVQCRRDLDALARVLVDTHTVVHAPGGHGPVRLEEATERHVAVDAAPPVAARARVRRDARALVEAHEDALAGRVDAQHPVLLRHFRHVHVVGARVAAGRVVALFPHQIATEESVGHTVDVVHVLVLTEVGDLLVGRQEARGIRKRVADRAAALERVTVVRDQLVVELRTPIRGAHERPVLAVAAQREEAAGSALRVEYEALGLHADGRVAVVPRVARPRPALARVGRDAHASVAALLRAHGNGAVAACPADLARAPVRQRAVAIVQTWLLADRRRAVEAGPSGRAPTRVRRDARAVVEAAAHHVVDAVPTRERCVPEPHSCRLCDRVLCLGAVGRVRVLHEHAALAALEVEREVLRCRRCARALELHETLSLLPRAAREVGPRAPALPAFARVVEKRGREVVQRRPEHVDPVRVEVPVCALQLVHVERDVVGVVVVALRRGVWADRRWLLPLREAADRARVAALRWRVQLAAARLDSCRDAVVGDRFDERSVRWVRHRLLRVRGFWRVGRDKLRLRRHVVALRAHRRAAVEADPAGRALAHAGREAVAAVRARVHPLHHAPLLHDRDLAVARERRVLAHLEEHAAGLLPQQCAERVRVRIEDTACLAATGHPERHVHDGARRSAVLAVELVRGVAPGAQVARHVVLKAERPPERVRVPARVRHEEALGANRQAAVVAAPVRRTHARVGGNARSAVEALLRAHGDAAVGALPFQRTAARVRSSAVPAVPACLCAHWCRAVGVEPAGATRARVWSGAPPAVRAALNTER
ncbi:hypothetical protein PybrP1_003548 [[Pythium] brassicae (nom. inval.)]|nr:hypothetical protein PybrP1_003548 [[Pythium] brassicae (nom. inval.)]